MNNLKYFSVFLLYTFFSHAQNNIALEVFYSYSLDFSTAPAYNVNSRLILDSKSSIYEIDHIGTLNNVKETNLSLVDIDDGFSNNTSIIVPSEENEYVYKSFDDNIVNYSDDISFKEFIISDKMPDLIWEFKDEQKTILEFNCKRATTSFRGRKYEAFYSEEIALNNGPWLFQGLPGLILEVNCIKANDLVFKIQANSIRQLDSLELDIVNPYDKKNTISWKNFLTTYRKKYDQTLRDNMTPSGPSYSLVKKSIMTYIED
jgi:GLPGLI family protein